MLTTLGGNLHIETSLQFDPHNVKTKECLVTASLL